MTKDSPDPPGPKDSPDPPGPKEPPDPPGPSSDSGGSPLLDPAALGADDRAFLLGDGIFETLRVYGGVPFRLSAHLDRLAAGAAILGLAVPGDLETRVRGLLDRAGARWPGGPFDASLRITLSRGRGGDLGGDGAAGPTAALRLALLSPDAGPARVLSAVIEGRLHEGALSAGLKGIVYLERVLALRRARARGAEEALLRNARDLLVEGTASNLLAILPDRRLVAPGRAQGALPGITRAVVLDEARAMGFQVEERGLDPRELPGVEELLLTSSIREVAPVVRVEGSPVGGGAPGPVARQLQKAFRAVVRGETGGG